MYRKALYSALLVLAVSAAGCAEPGETIFGTPVIHHLVGYNTSDVNVEVVVSRLASEVPPDSPDWQDVPMQYEGSPGRASWDIEEGEYYISARRKATGQVYISRKKILLDSNPQNRTFESHPVAAVMNVTPGHWSFAP